MLKFRSTGPQVTRDCSQSTPPPPAPSPAEPLVFAGRTNTTELFMPFVGILYLLSCEKICSSESVPSKHTTSAQRRCNVTTLQQRCNDVVQRCVFTG